MDCEEKTQVTEETQEITVCEESQETESEECLRKSLEKFLEQPKRINIYLERELDKQPDPLLF